MLSAGLAFASAAEAHAAAGLVGPNAVTQLAAALRATPGESSDAERVFASAGFPTLLHFPPDAMIDEAIPARLFEALWRELPPEQAMRIAHDAGRRTGAYVLAHRIPKAVRVFLRTLPRRFASALLLSSVRRNAWTFVGSGTCRVISGEPALVTITQNPLAMPGCAWHVGVFECLFRALVSEATQVRHTDLHANGVPTCGFEIDFRAGSMSIGAQL